MPTDRPAVRGWSLLPPGAWPLWLAASYALLAFVVWASLKPGIELPPISQADKFGHFLAYFTLTLWFAGFHPRGSHWRIASWLLLLGAAIEFLQQWSGFGRLADVRDMLANSLGIACACVLARYTMGWPRRVESWLRRR